MKTYFVVERIVIDDNPALCHRDCELLAADDCGRYCNFSSHRFLRETQDGDISRAENCVNYTKSVNEDDLDFVRSMLLTHINRNNAIIEEYNRDAEACLKVGDKEMAEDKFESAEEYKKENARINDILNNFLVLRK